MSGRGTEIATTLVNDVISYPNVRRCTKTLPVQIKWCKQLSETISVCIRTRQGGLFSRLLFNICYQELADTLSKCPGGIRINNDSYNVFCYADDLIVTSLDVTGLQELI